MPETRAQSHKVVQQVMAGAVAEAGEGQPLALLRFDTDAIGDFVYESSRPPVIAGASSRLRELNQQISERYRDRVIFSGGGEGLLLLAAARAAEVARDIEQRFHHATVGALGVTVEWVEVRPEDFTSTEPSETEARDGVRRVTGTQAVLARLHDRIRRKKDERRPGNAEIPGSLARCVSCRDRLGVMDLRWRRSEEKGELCRPCDERWETGRRLIAGSSFEELVEEFARARGKGDEERSKTRQLGFLYADGNGMGRLFGRLASLGDLRFLSGAVQAVFGRLDERVKELLRQWLRYPAGKDLPWLSLLAGGDEGIWILPAAVAVEAAERLPGWLAEEAAREPGLAELLVELGEPPLSVGMGLLICQYTYPVRYQYELAKVLQKNAKTRFYAQAGKTALSALDFEVLTDASPLSEDLDSVRSLVHGTEEAGFLSTCRPYTAEQLSELRRFLELGSRAGLAASQLHGLAGAVREGEAVFLSFLRYQLGRGSVGKTLQRWLGDCGFEPSEPDRVRAFAVRDLAQGGRGTWFGDALELAPYLRNENGKGGGDHATA